MAGSRDDVRSFVRGEAGKIGSLMQRLYGSDDLFPDSLRETCRPHQSINFVTAHDGSASTTWWPTTVNTMRPTAMATGRHRRQPQLELWRRGRRERVGRRAGVASTQAKNFVALLMLANGLPMIVAGDEFLHTQHGNNNPYNQDNEITWLDWSRLEQHREVFRFFKLTIAFRKSHPCIGRPTFWRMSPWHGVDGAVDSAGSRGASPTCCAVRRSTTMTSTQMINGHWEDHHPRWRTAAHLNGGASWTPHGRVRTTSLNRAMNPHCRRRVTWWVPGLSSFCAANIRSGAAARINHGPSRATSAHTANPPLAA